MATTNTSTIGSTGKDYTTIELWEAATDNDLVTADTIEVGQLDAGEAFNEAVTIAGATVDSTRYRKLTVSDGNWHEGAWSDTKARMLGAPSNGRFLTINENYFQVEKIQFQLDATTSAISDEGIRVTANTTGVVISRCIGEGRPASTDARDQDFIYITGPVSTTTVNIYIDNCLAYNWGRAFAHLQGASADGTANIYLDHNIAYNTGHTLAADDGGLTVSDLRSSSLTINWHIYNCVSYDSDGDGGNNDIGGTGGSGSATVTYTGGYNATGDSNQPAALTNKQEGITDTSVWVDPTNDDFIPRLNSTLHDNGTNRQGSEPDSRQDFSTDISGEPRLTTVVDIGSYALPEVSISTIGSTGKDYSTIETWESATDNGLVAAHTIEIGQLDAQENFNESITITGATSDERRYRKLTVSDGNWHEGTYAESGIARMIGNPSGRQLHIQENYFMVERLLISHAGGSDASDEAIRVDISFTGVVISRCILRGNRDPSDGTGSNDTDGIYINHSANSQTSVINVDNCVIYDWMRSAINVQFYNSGHDGGDVTLNVDHCTMDNCGNSGAAEPQGAGINVQSSNGSTTSIAINLYNSVGGIFHHGGEGNSNFVQEDDQDNNATWAGSYNADCDGSLTSMSLTTGVQDSKTRASIFTDADNDDYTPVAAEALENNGVNRIGSEPDIRQDFSLDIAEVTRGTTGVEIGAYIIEAVSGVDITGDLTLTVLSITNNSNRTVKSSSSVLMPSLDLTSSVSREVSSSGDLTLPIASINSTVFREISPIGDLTLTSFVVTGTVPDNSSVDITGSLILAALGLTGQTNREIKTSGGIIIPSATLNGQSSREIKSSNTFDLSAVSLNGVSTREIKLTSSLDLAALTLNGVAGREVKTSGGVILPSMLVSGTSGISGAIAISGSLVLPSTTVSGTAKRSLDATGDITTPAMELLGQASREVKLSGSISIGAFTLTSYEIFDKEGYEIIGHVVVQQIIGEPAVVTLIGDFQSTG